MIDRLLLFFLFLLSQNGFAQNNYTDSLLQAIQKSNNPKQRFDLLLDLGEHYYGYNTPESYEKATSYFDEALKIALDLKDTMMIAQSYHSQGQIHDGLGGNNLAMAIKYYSLFNTTVKQQKDTAIIIRSTINLAHTYMRLQKINEAKLWAAEGVKLALKTNKIKLINRAAVVAAIVNLVLKDSLSSLQYYKKIDLQNDTFTNTVLTYNLWYHRCTVELLRYQKKYDKAELAAKEWLSAKTNIDDSIMAYNALANIEQARGNWQMANQYKDDIELLYKRVVNQFGNERTNFKLVQSQLALKEENADLIISKQKSQMRTKNWLVTSLCILLAATVIIYWFYKSRKKQNILLQNQVEQNAVLLKEMHHRVKNNLQIISSYLLLAESKGKLTQPDFTTEFQTKLQTMALLHQKLGADDNFTQVDMELLFEQIVNNIKGLVDNNELHTLSAKINTENIFLKQDKATTLALITNEMLLNTIKHVLPHNDCLIIIQLSIKNNAWEFKYLERPGNLPFDTLSDINSTGIMIMKQLTKQIGGEITIVKNETYHGYSIIFTKE